jgi:uncharacterized membrane protein YkoI
MKSVRFLSTGAIALLVSGAVVLLAPAEEEQAVEFSGLPAAVQATVQQHLNGGTIEEVEVQMKDGQTVYEVDVEAEGEEIEFVVAADGTYLGEPAEEADDAKDEGEEKAEAEDDDEDEIVISLTEAPVAVRDAVDKLVAGNPVTKIIKETDDGVTEYEAEYSVAGAEQSVKLSEAGDVLEVENEVEPAVLPEAVRKALADNYPGSRIAEATAVEEHYYEVEIEVNGKTFEVEVSPSGAVEGDEHEGMKCKAECDKDDHHGKKKGEQSEVESEEGDD